ncbi:competence protein CoiA family protein [Streptomyces globisporus]
MKEHIARTAQEHGLTADTEARSDDGRIRTDVLIAGPAGKVGWEAQYSPITAATVRRRSTRAVDHGITPLWVTSDGSSALVDRAPWILVDDQPWHVIASRKSMLVRAGARNLQEWRCDENSQRPCPGSGSTPAADTASAPTPSTTPEDTAPAPQPPHHTPGQMPPRTCTASPARNSASSFHPANGNVPANSSTACPGTSARAPAAAHPSTATSTAATTPARHAGGKSVKGQPRPPATAREGERRPDTSRSVCTSRRTVSPCVQISSATLSGHQVGPPFQGLSPDTETLSPLTTANTKRWIGSGGRVRVISAALFGRGDFAVDRVG